MSSFDAEPEQVIVFKIDGEYFFSEYFERTDVFEALSEYYNETEYRFEVSEAEFEEVCEI